MRFRKPLGWPKLMRGKLLANGSVAYYWDIPSWAKKAGCMLRAEALGTDYGTAKRRCDELLNPQFDCWRLKNEPPLPSFTSGTFDWLVAVYKSNPKFTELPVKTQKSYDSV